MKTKRIVIITGVSGSGKSLALNSLEEMGYYVCDNLAPQLLPSLVDLLSPNEAIPGLAVVIDKRSGELFDEALTCVKELKSRPTAGFVSPVVLYLDCAEEELIRRFRETRRKHPLSSPDISILDAIRNERAVLQDMRGAADRIIDTSKSSADMLRKSLKQLFDSDSVKEDLNITIMSFGYKYGAPLEADLMFDVRFLKNPYWVSGLRELTGLDKAVKEYVLSDSKTKNYLKKLYGLIDFTIPEYTREGKAYLTIAIGCTGGRHRSITIADELGKYLISKNYPVRIDHREAFRFGR
ncbi:MAG: RNase adapter RapZ [Abditibacteriota bacterium]|nr:RNase adapter RapZ [Abditibacteriota bacterium]